MYTEESVTGKKHTLTILPESGINISSTAAVTTTTSATWNLPLSQSRLVESCWWCWCVCTLGRPAVEIYEWMGDKEQVRVEWWNLWYVGSPVAPLFPRFFSIFNTNGTCSSCPLFPVLLVARRAAKRVFDQCASFFPFGYFSPIRCWKLKEKISLCCYSVVERTHKKGGKNREGKMKNKKQNVVGSMHHHAPAWI